MRDGAIARGTRALQTNGLDRTSGRGHGSVSVSVSVSETVFRYHRPMPRITSTAEFSITEKRSRFLALAAPASTMAEAKKIVAQQKKKHHKARHHCWACRFFDEDNRLVEQARDAGEVGHPGMILLEQLRRDDLEGVIVVSRFFGGVKLGPAGVGRAFRTAGEGALDGLSNT